MIQLLSLAHGSIEMTQSVPPPHREGVAPLQQRDYDGKFVVTHTVQHGQTLMKIAAIYLFPRWEPIWIYNTKVERVLGDDPNLIRKGVTIFIPRSKDGYDALIKEVDGSVTQAESNGDRLTYELEAEWNSKEATRVAIDFAGNVATSLVTISLKARSAAKLAVAAEKPLATPRLPRVLPPARRPEIWQRDSKVRAGDCSRPPSAINEHCTVQSKT